MTSALAVIPAKATSTGLPGKNTRDLAGFPLYKWTATVAKDSCYRVVISTDDDKIAWGAAALGVEVVDRPPELAEPDVHAIHVVLDVLDRARIDDLTPIVLLLPTAPLRTAKNVQEAVEMLQPGRSVVGVTAVGPINSLRTVGAGGEAMSVVDGWAVNAQRQDVLPVYRVNGAVFVAHAGTLRKHGTFHTTTAIAYKMPWYESIDINTEDDFRTAELLMQARQSQWRGT